MLELQPIQNRIYDIRGRRVMLDFDLARLYQVETKRLKEQVKRNKERFPEDFMFQLTDSEWRELVAICDQLPSTLKHSYILPVAFTEQGVAMLSAVLKSEIAVEASISIMRAFVYMRQVLMTTSPVSAEITELRNRIQTLEQQATENITAVNDLSEDLSKEIDTIYEAIGALSIKLPQAQCRRPVGFKK